ncbi:hypothetical protein BT63DRAFT_457494 [Microthyrium microscopicum]|uniref:Uncharacterized protein n=1 Tax=Microthyrium microscopicum TaxID=703497 RepID=A0A6A6U6G8_9PEZI|nr:hypothetical protein BT63DRAFT_457494 [Microthyrium microscopicum]
MDPTWDPFNPTWDNGDAMDEDFVKIFSPDDNATNARFKAACKLAFNIKNNKEGSGKSGEIGIRPLPLRMPLLLLPEQFIFTYNHLKKANNLALISRSMYITTPRLYFISTLSLLLLNIHLVLAQTSLSDSSHSHLQLKWKELASTSNNLFEIISAS